MTLRLTEDEARAIIDRINRATGVAGAGVLVVGPFMPDKPKRKGVKRGPSELELIFAQQLCCLALPAPSREHKFYPGREFRFDFAWPGPKIAVEVEGMVHRIKGRFKRDIEKYALALLAGWKVLRVGGAEVRSGAAAAWLVTLWEENKNEPGPGARAR